MNWIWISFILDGIEFESLKGVKDTFLIKIRSKINKTKSGSYYNKQDGEFGIKKDNNIECAHGCIGERGSCWACPRCSFGI